MTASAAQGFLDKLYAEAREALGPDATEEQIVKSAENLLKAHQAKMRLNARKAQLREEVDALAMNTVPPYDKKADGRVDCPTCGRSTLLNDGGHLRAHRANPGLRTPCDGSYMDAGTVTQ